MKTKRAQLSLAIIFSLAAASTSIHAASISGQGSWETTLQGRSLDGNFSTAEAYYDTSLNITWLANANYAGTTMTWDNATTWAATLNPYGSGVTGWRLPTTNDVGNDGETYTNINQGVDAGYNITSYSEMSHMFYITLGDKAYYSTSGAFQPDYGLTNSGPFANIQSSMDYWSSTEYAPYTTSAWLFNYLNGYQGSYYKFSALNAWAVHSGDVGIATSVPVPAAAWLLGSGLFGLIGTARRKAV